MRVFPIITAISIALAGSAGSAATANDTVAIPLFTPPLDTPLIIERIIWRDLGDAELQHKHQYRVVFHARPRGYEMVVELLSVTIDAPQKIQYLVDMQLANENYEPMSFLLSNEGVILAGDTNEQAQQGVREALKVAAEKARQSRSPKDAARVVAFLQQLENTTREARPDWPRALFVPQYDDYAGEGFGRTYADEKGLINWQHERSNAIDNATLTQVENCAFDPLKGYAVKCRRDTTIKVGEFEQKGWNSHEIWPEPPPRYSSAN